MAFLTGRLHPIDAAPGDGFTALIESVDSAEHFATFAANDNLWEAVVTAVTVLFTITTGLDYSPAYQFFLNSHGRAEGLQAFRNIVGQNGAILG